MAWTREQMAARAAKELKDGFYVNLGIGIPTLVSNYVPEDVDITLQSENGMMGVGPFPLDNEVDPDIINAGKQTVTELKGTSYFSSADSFGGDARRGLLEDEARGGDGDEGELGDDDVDAAEPGEGEGARLQDLRRAVLRRVLHGDDDAAGASDEVHRAAHALHHLAGDHPVGEVALLGDLQRAEHGHVDVTAADEREAGGAVEVAGAGDLGDRLLAGVDQVGVLFTFVGEGADAHHAVLGVEHHLDAGGDVVRGERGEADAEVDEHAVAKLLGDAHDDLLAGECHGSSSSSSGGVRLSRDQVVGRGRTVRCSIHFA